MTAYVKDGMLWITDHSTGAEWAEPLQGWSECVELSTGRKYYRHTKGMTIQANQ